jgi:hypothetical protein
VIVERRRHVDAARAGGTKLRLMALAPASTQARASSGRTHPADCVHHHPVSSARSVRRPLAEGESRRAGCVMGLLRCEGRSPTREPTLDAEESPTFGDERRLDGFLRIKYAFERQGAGDPRLGRDDHDGIALDGIGCARASRA